jgi:two-component system cell cycle sensor histidine kinase/response regulator CckA
MQLAKFTNNYNVLSKREFEAKIDFSPIREKTVLLIDDEEIVINISEMMLKRLGYRVLKAHSGYEGLQLFEENKSKIDLIISDLQMPKMNGKEVMAKLREIDPQIKVMLSSGALTDADEKNLMDKGFNGFIKKPYNMNTLCKKMAEIIN